MSCPECSTSTLTIVHTHGQVHYLQSRIAELEQVLRSVADCLSCPKCAEMCRELEKP